MTPERYQLINKLADAALDLPADQRSAYLEQACAGDPALRLQLDRLIAAHGSCAGLLETPLLEVLAKDLTESRSLDLTGRQVQGYTIVSLLGRGGIGEVWLARDARLDRQVALKLLSPRFASDPSQVRRFRQEARAASKLNHPNIVIIYEIGEAQGIDFIAEEFVPGETLRERLLAGPMPLVSVLDIGTQVAAALSAAHQAGIVHRDIKPENIIVRPDGLVKVLDFGLARFLERQETATSSIASMTRPGFVLGTARYMSPEQARGLPVGPASDLFSLGVLLYEMVTGAPPFSGPTPSDVLAAILMQQPPPASARQPDTPPELERIIARCLEKETAARYASITDFEHDFKRLRWQIEAPGEPTPPSDELLQALAAHGRKPRWMFGATLAAAVALIAMLIAVLKLSQQPALPSLSSMQVSRLVTRGEVADAALSSDAKYVAYVLEEPRGESLRVVQLATGSDIQALPAEEGEHGALTFSPDGNYIYYRRLTRGHFSICRIPALGGDPVSIADNAWSVAVAPSGRQIAFFRQDASRRESSLIVANADGAGERKISTRRLPQYFSQAGLAWAPDERHIACFGGRSTTFSGDDFRLLEINIADGAERPLSHRGWRWAESIAWPTAADLVYFDVSDDLDDGFQAWTALPKNGEVARLTNDLNQYTHLGVASDSKTMLALRSQTRANVWVVPDADSTRALQITSNDVQNLNTLAWTPDGHVVYSAQGGDYRNIWIMDADGRNSRQLTRGPGNKTEVDVTRDGRYILYQGEGKIWRIDADGRNPRQLTFGALDVHPASSADSRLVIYASFPGWSPGSGGKPELWEVPIDGGTPIELSTVPASMPKVSPDGKWIGFVYLAGPNFARRELGVMPAEPGAPVKLFENVPPVWYDITWAPDGKALDFGVITEGVGNLWRQPLDGSPPRQITHFNIGQTFDMAWSPDGQRLAIARGQTIREVVLIGKRSADQDH